MTVVTMLELLLGRVTVWEEAAARHVSLQTQIQPLKALVVSLRERQLLEWKGLRQIREQHWERNGSKWWLHLIGLLSEDMEPRALVDELLKFLRTSPLGEFRLRLQMLHAAARLHLQAGKSSTAGLVAHHALPSARRAVRHAAWSETRGLCRTPCGDMPRLQGWCSMVQSQKFQTPLSQRLYDSIVQSPI
ncbi:Midasin (Dynein-related AAA-ATPase mdn1) (MIDAS-containing protein) [Durusdinium trenchii]